MRGIGNIIFGLGTAIIIIGSLWTIYLCFKIVFIAGGFWGVIIGAMVAPVLFFAAPIYAWLQWGDLSTPIIQYGSLFLGFVFVVIGGLFSDR